MPLKKGSKSYDYNVRELVTQPILSPARRKAIMTLAKKHNISFNKAKDYQAQRIAEAQLNKR